MPIKGKRQYLTENDVRMWLRDNSPEDNLLLDDYEFSADEIQSAMTYCQDYWNETPPYIGNMDFTETPFRYHLLQGTAAQLLFMASNRFRRNALSYSAGGLTVQDQEKFGAYEGAASRLWAAYHEWVAQNKRSLNMARGWGYV